MLLMNFMAMLFSMSILDKHCTGSMKNMRENKLFIGHKTSCILINIKYNSPII